MELLLAFLDQQLAFRIKHVGGDIQLAVGYLVSRDRQAALLDRAEALTGVRHQTELLDQRHNADAREFDTCAAQNEVL